LGAEQDGDVFVLTKERENEKIRVGEGKERKRNVKLKTHASFIARLPLFRIGQVRTITTDEGCQKGSIRDRG
jgi:hypothetical protein